MRANRRDRRSMLMQANNVGQGAAAATPWEASIHIDGTTFNTTQIISGFPGARDDATTSTRTYLAAPSGSNLAGGSLWSAVIKGTSAKLVINRKFGGGFTNAVFASIDGGAFVNIPEDSLGTAVKGYFTLFTGLSDAEHYVVVRIGSIFGIDSLYWDDAHTDTLVLTGTDTYIEMCDQWAYAGVASSHSVVGGMTKASATNYTPARTMQNIYSTVSNCASARIRGRFRSIQVACAGGSAQPFSAVYVSKNGAAPTKYSFTDHALAYTYRVTGLDESLATYTVWTNYASNAPISMFAISGDADHADVGDKKRIDQFGDSITYGGGGAVVPGEVDVLRVAASMGYVATTAGIAGHTIANLETALTTYLAALTVTSNDVAILAIGRNNTGGAFDAAETTSYTNIINALVTKGYGKVICRGILPSGTHSTEWTAENGSISSIVAGIGNSNVVFCDVSGLGTYTTQASDTTHPDAAGYATIAAYVEPLYRTILGL